MRKFPPDLLRLNRKGSRPKRKMNRSREARLKECGICKKRFNTQPGLIRHWREVHESE